jgi:hypothetical protein
MVLREYMACLDSDDPDKALEYVEPGFQFLIAAYIASRNAVERVHHILRSAGDADLEMVYGVVTEAGKPIGAFHSAAVVSPGGRMARYQSFFTTSFGLFDWPVAS